METAKGEQERAKWRWDSLSTRKWLGMSQFSAPWTGRQGVLIRGLDRQRQCSRLLDCVDVQFEKAKQLGTRKSKKKQSATVGTQQTVAQIVDSLFCDASQGGRQGLGDLGKSEPHKQPKDNQAGWNCEEHQLVTQAPAKHRFVAPDNELECSQDSTDDANREYKVRRGPPRTEWLPNSCQDDSNNQRDNKAHRLENGRLELLW